MFPGRRGGANALRHGDRIRLSTARSSDGRSEIVLFDTAVRAHHRPRVTRAGEHLGESAGVRSPIASRNADPENIRG